MKRVSIAIAGSILALAAHSAMADRVGGSPKANFSTNELSIPCVKIESLSEETEGMYFDIVLVRRGKSYNYELSAAEPEDSALCQRIADFAEYEDDDYAETGSDDDKDAPDILAQCEVTATRSKVSVKGKDLEAGDYYAIITSGDNTLQSMTRTISDDEVEFEFDSNSSDVLENAEAISSNFIVAGKVKAEIFKAGTEEALLDKTVSCLTAG